MSSYRWTILAVGVFAQASFSALLLGLSAIAPVIQSKYGLSLTQMGVVFASLNVGLILTLLPWGLLTDRIGERAVMATGLILAAAALVGVAYSHTFSSLVALLTLAGAAGGSVNAASGRAVMGWFGAEERGLALGIRQTAVTAGGAVAAIVLPALSAQVSLRAAFLALAGGCLAGVVLAVALLRELRHEPDQTEFRHPLRDRRMWRLLFGSTLYLAAQIGITAFLVLFLHRQRGMSTGSAAAILAATQALGGVARIAAGRWSDRVGSRIVPLRTIGLVLTFAVGLTALLVDASRFLILPSLVVSGVFALAWNGLSFTAAAETAGRARSGAALGFQQTALALGGVVTPIGFAAVVHASSWRIGYALVALCPLAGYAILGPLVEPPAGPRRSQRRVDRGRTRATTSGRSSRRP